MGFLRDRFHIRLRVRPDMFALADRSGYQQTARWRMHEELQIHVNKGQNGTVVAALEGIAGFDQLEQFESSLRMLALLPGDSIVLDFSKLVLISSVSLGALIRFRNGLSQNRALRLAGMQPQVAAAFENARLDAVFNVLATAS